MTDQSEDRAAQQQPARVVLITGAAKRIGAQLARSFHEQGYNVLLHCHHSLNDAEQLAESLCRERADSAKVVCLDLGDIHHFSSFTRECLNAYNRIDVLINNASAFFPTRIEDIAVDQFDELIATNLRAPFFLSKHFAPHLSGGCILNIIDIYGNRPLKNFSAYSISKAGLTMMTQSLALELAPDIRVNGISPGAILWPENESAMSASDRADLLNSIPMGTIGSPVDIAKTALFMANESSYITGQILAVDGGSGI